MKHISLTIYVHLSHSFYILVTLLIFILQQSLNLSLSIILSFSLSPPVSHFFVYLVPLQPLLSLQFTTGCPEVIVLTYVSTEVIIMGQNMTFLSINRGPQILSLRYTGSKKDRQKIEKGK